MSSRLRGWMFGCTALVVLAAVAPVWATSDIVISQVYGGGGNAGSHWKNDFIELFNRGTTAQSLNGWSVQYASVTGSTWQVTNLGDFLLQPGQYYLVQEGGGTSGDQTPLPAPDATGAIAMSATNGKVALVSSTAALTGTCPTGSWVDLLGFGPTASCSETSPTALLSNTTAAIRNLGGCTDTDNNLSDFSIAAPTPRNSSSPANPCSGPPTAACCYGHLCTVNTQAACLALSGTWMSGVTTCATNPCNYPSAACCYGTYLCIVNTHAECDALLGTWMSGVTTCDMNPCSYPTGACCVSGVCSITTQAACELIPHGLYLGDGTDCAGGCPPPTLVVISQVYGGGGNTGATYKNDFIELFNRGTTAVDITGWSVQYASATGTGWSGKTDITTGSIAPGQYYLIQEAAGTGGTVDLPTPDAIGTIAMGATAGKVALVNNQTTLTSCTSPSVVDLVGYGTTANCYEGTGPTPAPSNTTSVVRADNGCTDTDQNSTDFAVSAVPPTPRNSASPLNPCVTIGACCVPPGRACATCPGDMNGDSAVTMADIAEFVSVLLGTATNGCADTNGDTFFDGRDVQNLVNLIVAQATCGSAEECIIATEAECLAQDGTYVGNGTICEPNTCIPVTGLIINEFWSEDAGDDSAEYLELYCPSCGGASLAGLSVIIVDGDTEGNPLASQYRREIGRWDLAGKTMPLDGYFVIGGGTTPNVDLSVALGTGGFIQNGSQTYAIVRTPDIAYVSGTVLSDASVVAITANLIDAIGTTDDLDDTYDDTVYFGAPSLETNYGVDTASRIPNGTDTGTIADWMMQDNFPATELFSATDYLSSPGTANTITPLGVCCVGSACSMLTLADCDTAGGIWQGRLYDCTSNPNLNPCEPFGACCLNDTTCVLANPAACATLGGTYKGDNVPCTPLPCGPIGSCCLPDWTCQENLTQQQCTAVSATAIWASGGTCALNCIQPIGACCFGVNCSDNSTITACNDSGGIYQGDGTTCATGCRARPCLIISEVVDGHRPGGTPKWIEITNTGTADYTFLAGGIIIQSNAATDLAVDVNLAGVTITAGDSYVVCSKNDSGDTIFQDTYGFAADLYSTASFGNGDDRYILADSATPTWANLLDIYGQFGVSGTGKPWEYTDGYAVRAWGANQGNLGSFLIGDWSIFPNTLIGTDAEAKAKLQALTTPGVHSFDPCVVGSNPTPDRRITACPPACPTTYCLYQVKSTSDAIIAGEPGLGTLTDCLLAGSLAADDFICAECPSGGTCGTIGEWVLFEWVNYSGGNSCYFYAQVVGANCSGTCTGTSGLPKFKTVP